MLHAPYRVGKDTSSSQESKASMPHNQEKGYCPTPADHHQRLYYSLCHAEKEAEEAAKRTISVFDRVLIDINKKAEAQKGLFAKRIFDA